MRKKFIIIVSIIIAILIIAIISTNVIYNINEDKYGRSYECCKDDGIMFNGNFVPIHPTAPCLCNHTIFEKTFFVLKRIF